MIHHWQSYLGDRTLEEHAAQNPNGMLDTSAPAGDAGTPQAPARVSASCWIVDCPTGDGGAEFVNFADLRFFCCNCRNTSWGGKTLPVKVPGPQIRLLIEQVLLKRLDPRNRNWAPPETVDDLKAENLQNAVAP